ncbi:peptide chain release factor N(5)-glutamine methyltransferase [Serpentinicella alkaliphila]|uniref:Release factor glutamine methyltransferase n=1 Tax=Serpentinicella alkaliphila TaxID=1734049 RepID=A0A4V2T1X3_9FIRM|nr:peptide chain release factor N(5)-glutamine methyltransferase [Serpentinicella alkaliphila]QUH24984.1 peptide chain release factor N(5)-glutamine methyltransferase [Serpentinicella alkaliphila]TCP95163.1 release factor glutamine methyltransferase [Serpentinicella alkaliphila]
MMNISQLLKEAREQFEKLQLPTPQLDAEVLLCYFLNKDRSYVHIYPEKEISREICRKFWEAVDKRKNRMPIQYIVNYQQFMGLDFYVDERVLIPRGDTEILVEEVIEIYNKEKANEEVDILDIGTGSGAITISLAKYINKAQVYSVDISEKALEIAKINALNNGVSDRIEFLLGSMFEPLNNKGLEKSFDYIVSNPPYIPSKDVLELDEQVKSYEPKLALDGGEDGLDFYRSIIETAPNYLKNGAWLIFEIGYNQGQDLVNLMREKDFSDISVIKDLAGLDRVVKGKYK